MNKIKVVSNPYEKTVTFSRYDLSSDNWVTINSENNSNSKLVSAVFQRGFFPFKVHDILKEIEREYSIPDEKLELIFEGPNDEKQQLEEALKDELFSNIILSSSTSYLENARDVLPEINRIFRNLEPLIIKNIGVSNKEIETQLKRFSDASGDTVPICVLGTYSAGKSNAVITEKNEDLRSREAELEASLDDQKLVIVESLKSTSLSMENDLLIQYPKEMKIFQEDLIKQINKDDVLNRFNDIQTEILSLNATLNLTEHQQIDISNLKLGNISNEVSNYLSVTRENKTKKINLENLASAQTVDYFRNKFVEELYFSRIEFERISSSFWSNHASEIKSHFERIISGDLGLEPEKRQKLSQLILSYEEIDFTQLNLEKFSKEELSYVFRLGDFTLKSSKVNASGLKKTYNDLFKSKMTEFAGSICSEHEKAFKIWLVNLTSIIVQNIIEFSPELSALNTKIQKTRNEVANLEEQQQQIENYTNQIKRMITWK